MQNQNIIPSLLALHNIVADHEICLKLREEHTHNAPHQYYIRAKVCSVVETSETSSVIVLLPSSHRIECAGGGEKRKVSIAF